MAERTTAAARGVVITIGSNLPSANAQKIPVTTVIVKNGQAPRERRRRNQASSTLSLGDLISTRSVTSWHGCRTFVLLIC